MLFGFLVLVAGCLLVLLAAAAGMNHPTGGDRQTSESMRDGGILAAIGVVIIAASWVFG